MVATIPEARPRCFVCVELMMALRFGDKKRPYPSPSTIRLSTIIQSGVAGVRKIKKESPSVVKAMPAVATTRGSMRSESLPGTLPWWGMFHDRWDANTNSGAGVERYDVTVIGAGPAGLFCAIHAARPECRLLLLEKNSEPGAKLLLAGSGHCNITHTGDVPDFIRHYGNHGKFVKPALHALTNRGLMAFFESRGLAMQAEESGKVFPETRKSSDVLAVLVAECKKQGVMIRYSEPVQEISRGPDGFTVTTGKGAYRAATVVITTGGASYPQ